MHCRKMQTCAGFLYVCMHAQHRVAHMHKYINMLQRWIMSCDMMFYGVSIKHRVTRHDVELWRACCDNASCAKCDLAHEAYL
jgi:hypothetical protein